MKRVATAAATYVKRARPASVDDGGEDNDDESLMMMKGIFRSYGISYLERLTYIRPLPVGVSEPSGSKVGTSHSSTPQPPRDPIWE